MKLYDLTEELEELLDKALANLDPDQFDTFIDRVEQIVVDYQDKSDERR